MASKGCASLVAITIKLTSCISGYLEGPCVLLCRIGYEKSTWSKAARRRIAGYSSTVGT